METIETTLFDQGGQIWPIRGGVRNGDVIWYEVRSPWSGQRVELKYTPFCEESIRMALLWEVR